MSKPNATLAVLATLVLCCSPMVAATISSEEVRLRLGGSAQEVGLNHYHVAAGSVALLGVKADPRDLIWVFAVVEDAWGEADYGNILTLFFGRTEDGIMVSFFEIPAELAGKTFHIIAVATDGLGGDIKSSPELIVEIPGLLVLTPPALPRAISLDPI